MYECDAYLCRAAAVQIMGNEGGMSDESRFPEVWAGFSGTFREDIIEGFQPSSYYRDCLYTSSCGLFVLRNSPRSPWRLPELQMDALVSKPQR
jgi:hypothetical protein